MSDRHVFVYVDLHGETVRVGELWSRAPKGRETATFRYDTDWLARPGHFALEPSLRLDTGVQQTGGGRALFGALGDSAPDRWGRMLMRRSERRTANANHQTPRALLEIDFLLGVDDEARQGALRFKTEPDGPFLADVGAGRIPPFIDLPRLLAAATHVIDDEETEDDLRLLLAPGSSLGGARPKASVRMIDGQLAIAKFPSGTDEYDVVRWEAVALTLAQRAGIHVASATVEFVDKASVLLVSRFDRIRTERIPFLSAMSMLGAHDNDPDVHSYLEIADAIRMYSAAPKADLQELWRRMVFTILISNTDDHLRNHGFLYHGSGWRLSPAYDLNPVPADIKSRILTTAIDLYDTTASLELAMSVSDQFDLPPERARTIVAEVGQAVGTWRECALQLGVSRQAIARMASAFEHKDLVRALG